MRRMIGERYRREPVCQQGLHVPAFPFIFAGACTGPPRPPPRLKLTVRRTAG